MWVRGRGHSSSVLIALINRKSKVSELWTEDSTLIGFVIALLYF
jgi:hypothetical protein